MTRVVLPPLPRATTAPRTAPDAASRPTAPARRAGRLTVAPTPREVARSLAGQRWEPLIEFREPRWYRRVAEGPGWEAWLLSWLPGQSTGLHDHGGSAGAFAVLRGAVDEVLPLPSRPDSDDAEAGRTRLARRRYRAGQVRAFPAHHLHDVAAGGELAVTLHVYAPRLVSMTRYALVDGALAVTSREREGQDW